MNRELLIRNNSIFEEIESEVRSYCRKYTVKFRRTKNAEVFTEDEILIEGLQLVKESICEALDL